MKDREVTIISHAHGADTVLLETVPCREGIPYRIIQPFRGERLPDQDASAGIVCLGGPMRSYDDHAHGFLANEKSLLRKSAEAGVPILAICLGAQLLADALGGRAKIGTGLESGYIRVSLTEEGQSDPILRGLGGPYFSFHIDTFLPPPGATVLAETDRYIQAFRVGSALAVQFHPEISIAGVRRLIYYEHDKITASGVDGSRMIADAESYAPGTRRSLLLLTRFLASL